MAKTYLSDFFAVSVRDDHSKSIIQQYCQTEVVRVVDPTLLVEHIPHDKKYTKEKHISIYSFKIAALTMAQEIAKIKKIRIKTLGFRRNIGKSILDTPKNIFNHYDNAEYVITDTFHGTVFAIKQNTQFITYVQGKTKVLKLLEEYGLSNRNAMGLTPSEAAALLDEKIDYEKVNKQLSENRESSLRFLKEALEV